MAKGRSGKSDEPEPGSSRSSKASKRAEVVAKFNQQQARQKRRSRLILASSIVVGVLIVGGAVVAIGLNRDPGSSQATTAVDAGVIGDVTSVSAATYDTIGAGTAAAFPKAIQGTALTADGKPRVLYVGAEYCPFCAAERWSVVAALSRFGTFTNLGQTASAHGDVYPDTATLSFHGSSYTSDYLSFTGVETTSNQVQGSGYAPLDSLTADDEKTFDTYDYPPYVSSQGSIPFIDIGGQYVVSGASYDPALLKGMTHAQIATAMQDPTSKVATAIDGSANVIAASLCKLTGDKPAAVCTSSGVTSAASKLG